MNSSVKSVQIPSEILAPFWKRLLAWIIDQILLVAIVLILMAPDLSKLNALTEIDQKTYIDLAQLTIIVNIGYFSISEGLKGQSIGKKILGLKVYKKREMEFSFKAALLRRIGMVVPLFSIVDGVAILFTSKNQRIFDIIAGTIVIEEEFGKEIIKSPDKGKMSENSSQKSQTSKKRDRKSEKDRKTIDNLENLKREMKEKLKDGKIERERYLALERSYNNRIRDLKNQRRKKETE